MKEAVLYLRKTSPFVTCLLAMPPAIISNTVEGNSPRDVKVARFSASDNSKTNPLFIL